MPPRARQLASLPIPRRQPVSSTRPAVSLSNFDIRISDFPPRLLRLLLALPRCLPALRHRRPRPILESRLLSSSCDSVRLLCSFDGPVGIARLSDISVWPSSIRPDPTRSLPSPKFFRENPCLQWLEILILVFLSSAISSASHRCHLRTNLRFPIAFSSPPNHWSAISHSLNPIPSADRASAPAHP